MQPFSPEIPQQKLEKVEELVYPEFVYMNFDKSFYLMMLTTLKRQDSEEMIAQNVAKNKSEKGISLVFKNNEKYGYKKLSKKDFVEQVSRMVGGRQLDEMMNMGNLEEYDFATIKTFTMSMLDGDGNKTLVEEQMDRIIKLSEELQSNSKKQTKIVGAYVNGVFVAFEDFLNLVNDETYVQMSQALEKQSGVKKGDYLYRAVDVQEFSRIIGDRKFFVREETNFENEEMFTGDSQAKTFANQEGYSGHIIRFKTEGSFYKKAGTSPQRIASVVPHLVESIEILKDGVWVDTNDWGN
jgi:hypothetical protein